MENKYVCICNPIINWRLAVSSYCGYLTDSEVDPSDHQTSGFGGQQARPSLKIVVKSKIPPLVSNHTPAVQPYPFTSLTKLSQCAITFNSTNFYDILKYVGRTLITFQFADIVESWEILI
jgi:hypothetical protein